MLAEITQLLELQTIDGRLHEHAGRIERLHAHLRQIEERIVEEEAAVAVLRDELSALERDSRMKNLAVDELDMNIRQYQDRLDTGIISFKEMEDLRAKIASERNRISQMEDDALVLMDTIEDSKRALGQAIEETAAKIDEYRRQIAEIDAEIQSEQGKRDALSAERSAQWDRLPPYLANQYETLRKRSSEPIAIIKSGTCSGCKLKLSGSTIERVRGSMAIVTCEHCSRILYVEDFSHDE